MMTLSELVTPDVIIRELVNVRAEASRGVDAQYRAEVKYAEATLAAEKAEAMALLSLEGTVVDRQAGAKLRAENERLAEAIAKAEYNRVRTKMKNLELAQMSIQTQARLVELMWKSAGQGER